MNVVTVVTERGEYSMSLEGLRMYCYAMADKQVAYDFSGGKYDDLVFATDSAAAAFANVLLEYLSGSRGVGTVTIVDKEDE
jgi:hypothetical protein